MSKAFTKEGAGQDPDDEIDPQEPKVPVGSKNYITPRGEKKLRDELTDLLNRVRPEMTATVSWAASLGDRSENADYIYGKKRLREIDRRIRFITKRLENIEVIDPALQSSEDIRFGATITIRYEDGREKTYSIVGIDETNLKLGQISWISPLGSVLLKKRVGDFVSFKAPQGEQELEILKVEYKTLK